MGGRNCERGVQTWQWCESKVEQDTGQMSALSLSWDRAASLTLAATCARSPTGDTLVEKSAYFLPRPLHKAIKMLIYMLVIQLHPVLRKA